ncbi:MAG: DnaJ family domain-containing protein [Actinomycetota bacterium]
MGVYETIADRKIREGRAAGLFDNLPGRGKPIVDLHTERPAGWWAARVVKSEREKLRREELQRQLRRQAGRSAISPDGTRP